MDEDFMRLAFEVAIRKGTDPAAMPIGCVIVRDGMVVAAEPNRVADLRDATAHAEIMALRAAGKSFANGEIRGATLYTTLQPCGMCTMACVWAKIGRIVYGAGREDVHHMYFECRHVDTLDILRDTYRSEISFAGGVLLQDCRQLYYHPDDNPPLIEQGNI